MRIGFVGLGKLGLPSILAIESKGHTVIGYDINPKVKEYLEKKEIPYIEKRADRLKEGITSFLGFLENKLENKTSFSILEDLAKFQVFSITMKDDQREIKSEYFKFDWKEFFVGSGKISEFNKKFYYNNKILESDNFEWNKKVIWYGRRTKKLIC